MKTLIAVSKRLLCLGVLWLASDTVLANSGFKEFITVRGDQLMEGSKPFRFVSFNIPNLHLVEDNMAFAQASPWRWPDRFETTDALGTIRQMGGRVARTYVISVVRTNDEPGVPRHVLGPGKFNEEAFRALDMVLQVANETGVRLIIPFVDNWVWWGGRAEYAGFRGKTADEFWTDRQVIADFKETIRFILTRTNTLTGVRYCEDRSILCWETGNELTSPAPWTREIAAYIKSLDRNHLVMDGFHSTRLRPESLEIPEVDIVTTHHYPGEKKTYTQLALENWAMAKGRKPYVLGEFGFVETSEVASLLKTVRENHVSGALLWSLRPRSREGGFYWHSEPAGGNKYKAYHWPGFATGAEYDEPALMALMQQEAYAIRGLPIPKLKAPQPPRLLPVVDEAGLAWQGSVGAASYVVERATAAKGPWREIASGVDESAVQHRPLYTDTNATPGQWFYRIRAVNAGGQSKPSNVLGPVNLKDRVFIDELAGTQYLAAQQGKLGKQWRDSRKAKEDAHRLSGEAGTALVYQLPGAVRWCRVYAFFPKEPANFKCSVSLDGKAWSPAPGATQSFSLGSGDYGYWTPILYRAKPMAAGGSFLKIEFGAEAQVGRIEIGY